MIVSRFCNLTRGLCLRAVLSLVGLLAVSQTPVFGQPAILRIECDWALTVTTPDPGMPSPQVTVQMAPSASADYYFQFHINHAGYPTASTSGLQLEAWQVSTGLLNSKSSGGSTATMNTANETVAWTQWMDVNGNVLKSGVSNGVSQTWGSFSLTQITVPGTYLNLNQVSPLYTLANSGVTFGAQRVTSLNPTAVRLYYSDGSMWNLAIPPNCFNLAQLTLAYTSSAIK